MNARHLPALAHKEVVFLNWRDPTHPSAGGAELYCWEIATRWAKAGAHVSLYTSAVRGQPVTETVGGVQIHRAGGRYSLYPRTLQRLRQNSHDADIVIDLQNGIPFFAPLVAGPRTAVTLVVHHVHQEQFRLHMPWPMHRAGQALEGPVAQHVYGRRPIVAVSPSTRSAVRLHLGLGGSVFVVPNGTPAIVAPTKTRSITPSIVVVGRLVPQKRIHLLIQAAAALRERIPALRVDIVGDGPERPALTAMARALALSETVFLHGRLTEAEKSNRLAAGWLHVQPSQAEGWGITVLEGAAHGVPTLAFDVPGLRDAIRPGRTGWLIDEQSSLSHGLESALKTLSDPVEAARMAQECRIWAGSFTWDESADRLAGVALAEHDRLLQGRPERRLSDETCVVRLQDPTDAQLGRLSRRLRRTDLITVDPRSGRVNVLLYGCDERAASVILAEVGIHHWMSMEPAGSEDLLAGGASFHSSETVPDVVSVG